MSTDNKLLALLVFTVVGILVDADNTILYVRPLNGSTQPCPEPCISLFNNVSQLDDLLSSGTVLKFLPGVHVLDQIIELRNKTDVSFVGDMHDGETSVTIACSVNTSIIFINCSNITIRDVTLDHCSNGINTSYMDALFAENYWYRFPLVPQAALIFVHCFSTTLHNLLISESPGFGVIGINMLGHTKVESVTIRGSGYFFCLTISTDPSMSAGGMFLLFQNTPSYLVGSNNSFTVTGSTFSSSCSPSILYPRNAVDLIGSGGISTIFGQNSYLLTLNIENSVVESNRAYYHAGLNFIYYTGVSGTNVSINNCSFRNNTMNSQSFSLHGTVAVSYATQLNTMLYLKTGRSFQQLSLSLYIQNIFVISDCLFTNNMATQSNGISFLSADEDHPLIVDIKNVHFVRNLGLVSSALIFVNLEASAFILDISIRDCIFVDNSLVIPDSVYNTDEVNYYKYASVVTLHNIQQATFTGSTVFKGNLGSSIFLYNSVAVFNGIFKFSDNSANFGAGLGIYSNSYILLHEGTNVSFISNIAKYRGGAVYVEDVYVIPSFLTRLCAFQYLSPQGNLDEIGFINIHIHFANNSAGEAGDSLFDSALDFCNWAPKTAFHLTEARTVNSRIFSFASMSSDELSSGAYRVCLCSPSYVRTYVHTYQSIKAACMNSSVYNTSVYPGEEVNIAVIGTDINFKPVVTFIYTAVANSSTAFCSINGLQQVRHELPKYCTALQYSVTSNRSEVCELNIRTESLAVYNPQLDVIVNMEILDCPLGFSLAEDGKCVCDYLLDSVADCSLADQRFSSYNGIWFLPSIKNDTITKITYGYNCPFEYCRYYTYFPLTDPDSQCRYKRSGILCGQCRSGYSSVFGSPQCKVCSTFWLSLLILFALVGIVLVVLLFILNFTITSGTINGLIFYANVISINTAILFPRDNTYGPLLTFISFLNLDLGIETCFYHGMDEYAKVWLEYVFPVYLIIIVVVIIVLARHSSRIQRIVQNNGVPVLSTLTFLSYTKLLKTSSEVLFYNAEIIHIDKFWSEGKERVWARDANVEYFGFKFSILFVVSLLVMLLIVIPFTILLIFTKSLLRFRWITRLKPILDAYQSPFVNPFRFWIGFRLLLRAFLFSISALSIENVLLINSITFSGLAVLQGFFRPFHSFYCNLWDLSFLLNLVLMFSVNQFFGEANLITVKILVGIIPAQAGMLLCYHIVRKVVSRNKMDQLKKLKLFSRLIATLNNSDMYKHLSMTHQDVRFKPGTGNTNEVPYAEMREPLVLQDDGL